MSVARFAQPRGLKSRAIQTETVKIINHKVVYGLTMCIIIINLLALLFSIIYQHSSTVLSEYALNYAPILILQSYIKLLTYIYM